MASEYRFSGLDISAVRWSDDRRLATYYVEYSVSPRATQVYYDRGDTCFTQLTPADIDWDYLLDTRLLHLSGLTMALCGNVRDVLTEAAARAKAAGVPVSFDMNCRRRLWTPEEGPPRPSLKMLTSSFVVARTRSLFSVVLRAIPERWSLNSPNTPPHIVMSMSHEGVDGVGRRNVHARSGLGTSSS